MIRKYIKKNWSQNKNKIAMFEIDENIGIERNNKTLTMIITICEKPRI